MRTPSRWMMGTLLVTSLAALTAGGGESKAPDSTERAPFAVAKAQFEQNATDGDVEVVFEVKGSDEGLKLLTITAPNGRTVAEFSAPELATLGIRQFRYESPEPKDVASLKAAYPEGFYLFRGVSVSGAKLQSRSRLSHQLPATALAHKPLADAQGVRRDGLVLEWSRVPDVAAYIVYVEQDALGVSLTTRLPATATSLMVPDGFLVAGTEYTLGIGTESKAGNVSYVESTFTTAPR